MKHLSTLFLALTIALLTGCGKPGPGQEEQPQTATGTYKVVCTTGMVADIARAVAGDRAEVTNLIGSGVDPHLFTPARGDVAALSSADLVFYSGLLLEGKMTDVLTQIGRKRPVYAVTEKLDHDTLLHPDGAEGHPDPHVWMDVAAWSKAVEVVEAALAEFDPGHADDYAARGTAYRAQLAQLDAYAKESLGSIPEESRVMVTAHDAFNYFGRAYGLEVMGIQGLSTESEAGLQRIGNLVKLLADRNIGAVFVESSVSPKNVRALVEGAAAQGHQVEIGGELFSDAMGSPGTYKGTYIGMLDHNITTVTRALGGTAPAKGMQGKLAGHPAGEE